MKIGIFTSFKNHHLKVVEACEDIGVDCEIVDVLSSDWISNVRESDCTGFFCPSISTSQEKKSVLDERYYFISQILKKPIYPDFLGLFIHENKRNMATWLEIHGYKYVPTKIFTNKKEALEYVSNASYPLVFKASLGSGARKVNIVTNRFKAKKFVKRVFPIEIRKRAISILNIGKVYWTTIGHIKIPDFSATQKDYLIIQEYKNIIHEWRIIKIGNSYFGHQKLLKGQFASGSGRVGWVAPPKELLYTVKELCDEGGFLCMDVDIFETIQGEYFINELQTSFGSYIDYQMCIDGKPGRYRFINNDFIFEEGMFNTFESNRLKIEHFIEVLKEYDTLL